MKKLIAMVVLSVAFISHNGFAESLLFTLDDGPTYDVSPLNDSNIDESVLVISLYSDTFENDFWNYEGDDLSFDFLDKYNFEICYKDTDISDMFNNHIYYYNEYVEYVKNNIRVSILFDNIYEIDISPVVEFYNASYRVPVDSYSDDSVGVVIMNHYIYEVPCFEMSYRYGLNDSLNEFMSSEYFKSYGFGSATITVNEDSTYVISEMSWHTSYIPSYGNEESPIPAPEPGTGLLVACGGVAFLGYFRRKIY